MFLGVRARPVLDFFGLPRFCLLWTPQGAALESVILALIQNNRLLYLGLLEPPRLGH
jgi:hypothetical protein